MHDGNMLDPQVYRDEKQRSLHCTVSILIMIMSIRMVGHEPSLT